LPEGGFSEERSLAKAGAEAGVLLTEGAEFGCEILLGGDEVRMSHVRGRAIFNEVEGHLAAHPHVAAVAQGYEILQVIAATTAVWKHMPHLMTASFLLTPQGCVHLDLLIHGKTQQGQATEATRRTIDLLVLEAFAAPRGCDGPSSSQTLWHVPRWGLPAAHLLGQRSTAAHTQQETRASLSSACSVPRKRLCPRESSRHHDRVS
jgi:hypothetical protein